jgi:hypothetical protein
MIRPNNTTGELVCYSCYHPDHVTIGISSALLAYRGELLGPAN